jgi:hypothetical protein
MNQRIQLKLRKLPQALGELTHSNQFLKISALFSYLLCALMLALLLIQSSKPPVILAFSENGDAINAASVPKPEVEVEKAIREYVRLRYNWEPKNASKRISDSQEFIFPSNRNSFQSAMATVVKFASEKSVSQKVHIERVQVDMEKRLATVWGDRITSIQGLQAAGSLKIELIFAMESRTQSNPWGIYITKEKEEL